MNGPTTVPCLVNTASTAMPRWLIRFMIFCCWPTMSSTFLSQSALLVRKKVVSRCRRRVQHHIGAEPGRRGLFHQLVPGSTESGCWARWARPASSPSLVVTIFESRCSRSAEFAGGIAGRRGSGSAARPGWARRPL